MRPRRAVFDESGVSLMEMLVICGLMAIAMAVSVPAVMAFYGESSDVQQTYSVVDQVIPATETIPRYLREAVQPSATAAPFSAANGTSATFYADTGSSTGPELMTAQLTGSGSSAKFTLTAIAADANSCPMTGSTGSSCTYLHGETHILITIQHVTNGATPVFTYTLQGGTTTNTPTAAQLSQIKAVMVNIQAQLNPGNTSGFSTLVYLLSPGYEAWVG
ncbi:MAG TPA: hypothetical protein VE991_11990 [Acidimicrobiales bacterium]|nr:hypothetical protein [Acidimicrobiales bacterium]